MPKIHWLAGACAVPLLLVTVGCKLTDFSAVGVFQGAAGGGDRTYSGSVNEVAFSLQATLEGLGLAVQQTQDGEALRLVATSKNGQHFSLILTQQVTASGEVTRVRTEWHSARDAELEGKVLAQGEVKTGPGQK
jgi:hypothetical protein